MNRIAHDENVLDFALPLFYVISVDEIRKFLDEVHYFLYSRIGSFCHEEKLFFRLSKFHYFSFIVDKRTFQRPKCPQMSQIVFHVLFDISRGSERRFL